MKFTSNFKLGPVLLFLCFWVWGGESFAVGVDEPVVFEPVKVSEIKPEQIKESELKPGLEAYYYLEFFERDLRRLPKSLNSEYRSFVGKPILTLNHQFEKEEVFSSGTNRGVGIRMTGYLHFAKMGEYVLQALSNDGIILTIDTVAAINDPEQHSDRLSNEAYVDVDVPGWYPVVVEYFQRKGTAALKLFWKIPGSDSSVPIPESAYRHRP